MISMSTLSLGMAVIMSTMVPSAFVHASSYHSNRLFRSRTTTAAFSTNTGSGGRNRVFVSTPVKLPKRVVGDCMSQDSAFMHVKASSSVDEAIEFLIQHGLTGAPVLNHQQELVGMISQFDFLSKEAGGALLPMEGTKDNVEGYANAAKKIIAQQVQEIMTPHPLTVDPQMSMREAAAIMVQHRLHHLPVVERNKLVGVLSSSNVMMDVYNVAKGALPESVADDGEGETPTVSP